MKKIIPLFLLSLPLGFVGCDALRGTDISTKEGFEKAVSIFVEQVDTTKEKVLEFSFSADAKPRREFSTELGTLYGSVIGEKGDTLQIVYHMINSKLTKEKPRVNSEAAYQIDAQRKVFNLSALSADRYLQHIEIIKKEVPAEYVYQTIYRYNYCQKEEGIEERYGIRLTKKGETGSYYEVTARFINGELEDIS